MADAEVNAVPARRTWHSPQVWAGALLLCLLGLVPVYAQVFDQPFYITLFARILIFAIAALGLNLILGYGALVSFGHALYIGIGAYAVGILSFHGVTSGWLHLLAGLLVGALAATIVGWVCLRTSGIAFIMITLAFAQMFYFLAVSLKQYGGDDGLTIAARSDFGWINLANNTVFYYVIFTLMILLLLALRRIVDSRFGMVLRGCKSNERRMQALGFPTARYKLAAYVLSALVCVIAGILLANLTKFASPSFMQWQASGDLIVMIVLGGLGTLIGPVAGAAGLLLLEEVLAAWTQHWMVILGPLIVLIVIISNRGIFGLLAAIGTRRRT
ncbi:MAG: branched-chain amino acid ABC transporter permease, partial [Betaproteobacteria bacterium]